MKIFDYLQKAIKVLTPWNGSWALCGGIAASLYRSTPRFTGDIDFMITNHLNSSAQSIAETVISNLGYKPIAGFIPDEKGKQIEGLVIGRESTSGSYVGIDILLPVLPWIEKAVIRAQTNKIDFGFQKLPTITIEDLIIAKLFAFRSTPTRPYDLDDILDILRTNPHLDQGYLQTQQEIYQFDSSLLPDNAMQKIFGILE